MSTATTTLFMTNNSDANFRAWAQWIHDKLTAFGWVQTSDTGQINLTTVTAPSGNVAQGYEIWRMADTLQATKPVFVKLEYGGAPTAVNPEIWLTMGTGSNGSGTLTGLTSRQGIPATGYTTAAVNCYASGDTNRFCFGLAQQATPTTAYIMFGVERTKNSDGTDSIEGAHALAFSDDASIGNGNFWHMSLPASGAIPAMEPFGCGSFPTSAQSTGIFGSDTFTYFFNPMMFYPRNPIMNWLLSFSGDFTREVQVSLDIYGSSHTYLPFGAGRYSNSSNNPTVIMRSVARFMMRYE